MSDGGAVKKILDDPASAVDDYIAGLVAACAHLARVDGWPVVVRAASKTDRVALVSGGGSGHEPAHAGYVGAGMLDAAVLGPVFTSPSVDSVLAGILSVATDAGVVLIVKNYTGDRLNFGLAADLARAQGVRVETVVVADDVALGDSSRAGRRGLTATVLAHKVAGAAAEAGRPIEEVVAVAERLLTRAGTMGVALGPCTVPGSDAASFTLGPAEVEWGLGIHGEAGRERGPLVPASHIARRLVGSVIDDLGLEPGADVVVLVNSLGGTPDLELRILHGAVLGEVGRRGLRTRMTWGGPLLTSLEMPGASATIAAVDDELLDLLAAPATVVAFPSGTAVLDADRCTTVAPSHPSTPRTASDAAPAAVGSALLDMVAAMTDAVIAHAAELTELDAQVGDGDLGINLERGARALVGAAGALRAARDATTFLRAVSEVLRREVGGTSGPLYSLFVLAMAESLHGVDGMPEAAAWSAAARAGLDRIRAVGGAAAGDRTMVDALQPAVEALGAGPRAAADAARAGADATASMRPALGRSSYLADRALGVPDPGAVAVAIQWAALADAVERAG